MKLDKHYSSVHICPETKAIIDDAYGHNGVCPECGDCTGHIWIHDIIISGRWNRPSLMEFLRGSRNTFLRKDDEDAVWETLKK